jgi:hypothetical protein
VTLTGTLRILAHVVLTARAPVDETFATGIVTAPTDAAAPAAVRTRPQTTVVAHAILSSPLLADAPGTFGLKSPFVLV